MEGRCREDLRQIIWFGLGYVVVLTCGYLLLRQINLMLSVEEMGRFSYLVGLVGLFASIFYLAASQAYPRFHENHCIAPRLHRNLMPVYLFAAAMVAFILFWKTSSWLALLYAAIPFFFERVYVFRAQLRAGTVNLLKIAELAIPLLLLAVLALWGKAVTAETVLAGYGLGYLVAFVFPLRLKPCASPSRSVLAKFLVPIGLTTLVAVLIEHLTVIATKALLGYEAAAEMGVAARNLIFVRALFQFFQMFYPVIYFREMKASHYRTVAIYRMVIVVGAIGFVMVMTVGAPLLYQITGATRYVSSSSVFVLLAVAALFDFLFDTFALCFQYEIKTWKTTCVRAGFLLILLVGFGLLALGSMEVSTYAFAEVVFAASLLTSVPGMIWAVCRECQLKRGG